MFEGNLHGQRLNHLHSVNNQPVYVIHISVGSIVI